MKYGNVYIPYMTKVCELHTNNKTLNCSIEYDMGKEELLLEKTYYKSIREEDDIGGRGIILLDLNNIRHAEHKEKLVFLRLGGV